MSKSLTCLITVFTIFLSSGLFANKDKLWEDARTQQWKPVRKWLKHSPNAGEDLKWVHEEGVVSVLDILLDWRKHIREGNPKLYQTVFGAQGLAPWTAVPQNAVGLDDFFVAARVKGLFDARLHEGEQKAAQSQKIVKSYRKLLTNTFSPRELQTLSTIYNDPDFQMLIQRCANMQEEVAIPREFTIDVERFKAVNPMLAVLEVILLDGVMDTTDSGEAEHYMAIHPVSEMLSDISNERIRALTEKLGSPLYRREVIKRQVFLSMLVQGQ